MMCHDCSALEDRCENSLFKLDVATRDILVWKHISVVSIIDMMEIFSVGLANKLMGIFKTKLIFCLKVIHFTQSFTHPKFVLIVFFFFFLSVLCKFLVAGSSSLHFYTSFLD